LTKEGSIVFNCCLATRNQLKNFPSKVQSMVIKDNIKDISRLGRHRKSVFDSFQVSRSSVAKKVNFLDVYGTEIRVKDLPERFNFT